MIFSRLTDKLVLNANRHPIDPEHRVVNKVAAGKETLEVFECFRKNMGADNGCENGIVALKFPGTGGRAERAGPHPAELLTHRSSVVYSVNPCGYGRSTGRATLHTTGLQCESVFEFVRERHPGWGVLLVGNSLGCVSALYLGARREVAGLYLRNPPPVAQMIRQWKRYNWWNFGMAKYIADLIPDELDCVANARKCTAPLFVTQSDSDTVVPVAFQNQIIEAYAGEKETFAIPNADHETLVPESLQAEFIDQATGFLARLA